MTKPNSTNRAERTGHIGWVPIGKMKAVLGFQEVRYKQAWVDALAADFDLDQLGVPVVSRRDGHYQIIDGQHRIAALRAIGFGPEQQIECWVYTDLDEAEEAYRFIKANDKLGMKAYPLFVAALTAGLPEETDVARIVSGCHLSVANNKTATTVSCVGTLMRVYRRNGPDVLGRTLRIILAAYGPDALEAPIVDGIARLCDRYNGALEDQVASVKLSKVGGGMVGLLQHAERVRQQTGCPKTVAVAAAAVEIINKGAGGKKLSGWWKAAA